MIGPSALERIAHGTRNKMPTFSTFIQAGVSKVGGLFINLKKNVMTNSEKKSAITWSRY